jgi:Xaa-Pro aminopeptidase
MAGPYSSPEEEVMEFPFENRRMSAQKKIVSNQLDGILFSSLENIRYLCGFTGSDGALVVTPEESFFLTDSRYWTQAEEEVKGSRIVHYKKKLDGILSLLLDLKLKTIGFESSALPFSLYHSLTGKLAREGNLVPLENELKNLRAVKDAQELALIRRAIEIASNSFSHVTDRIREGVLERTVAFEMEFFMKQNEADGLAFDIIVASGKRSALPHGKAGMKRIETGDFILIDYGAGFQGYHSDETCTVVLGNPSQEQKKIYQIVKEAHDKAFEIVRPGIPIQQVDKAARDHICQSGYGDYFGHSTGHGVGLAVHEDPAVNSENQDLIQEGMVFTIEPGIYLPDWGGVRIEDMVIVTPQGAKSLTFLPKDLRVV